MRTASNALPAHAEISFQAVIRNFDRPQQAAILQAKLRDLELSQLRMAPPFAVLTDGYRRALADYLDPGKRARPVVRFGQTSAAVTAPADRGRHAEKTGRARCATAGGRNRRQAGRNSIDFTAPLNASRAQSGQLDRERFQFIVSVENEG